MGRRFGAWAVALHERREHMDPDTLLHPWYRRGARGRERCGRRCVLHGLLLRRGFHEQLWHLPLDQWRQHLGPDFLLSGWYLRYARRHVGKLGYLWSDLCYVRW